MTICLFIIWGWAISTLIEAFVLCTPFEANYNPAVTGHCGNRNAAFVAAGTLNMFTDLMVMGIPIPYIISLQLRTSRKVALLAIFCLGIL